MLLQILDTLDEEIVLISGHRNEALNQMLDILGRDSSLPVAIPDSILLWWDLSVGRGTARLRPLLPSFEDSFCLVAGDGALIHEVVDGGPETRSSVLDRLQAGVNHLSN